MPRGTDGSTASSITKSIEHGADRTTKAIASGLASSVIGRVIPVRNSQLSGDEERELLRLRQIRKRGQMLTMGECDWLLELIERMRGI
jgi:hypothetical protein